MSAAAGVRIARRLLWLSGLVDNDPCLFDSGLKRLSIARGKLGPGRKRNAPQDFPESGFANRKECFLRCESGIGILQRIEDDHEFIGVSALITVSAHGQGYRPHRDKHAFATVPLKPE